MLDIRHVIDDDNSRSNRILRFFFYYYWYTVYLLIFFEIGAWKCCYRLVGFAGIDIVLFAQTTDCVIYYFKYVINTHDS